MNIVLYEKLQLPQPLWRHTSVQPVVTFVSFWSIVNSSLSHASDVCVALEGVFLHNFRAPFTAKVSSHAHTQTCISVPMRRICILAQLRAWVWVGRDLVQYACFRSYMY